MIPMICLPVMSSKKQAEECAKEHCGNRKKDRRKKKKKKPTEKNHWLLSGYEPMDSVPKTKHSNTVEVHIVVLLEK